MSLKKKREDSGLSQKSAADLFQIKYRTYQNYENGVTSPTMDTAAQFARFFNCTIGDLFDLEEGNSDGLSQQERELVEAFRAADSRGRENILLLAEHEANRDGK